ncbi:hypothetical protein [Streptomyces acidiscabies]|uniref:Uncharacterized protein n=1 Tax=Streptomyces acidiscabies TaxID=42234 RepID=A0ABU4LWE3_9ACTN|nr:hypothetical protein [Streptomyces acidiscabies]MDX3020074.1 hypothetical protein [Streptomyces acidiscabies]
MPIEVTNARSYDGPLADEGGTADRVRTPLALKELPFEESSRTDEHSVEITRGSSTGPEGAE